MAVAIIAEYNPFHNGHKFQLDYAKKHFPNDKIIIIMSVKYVQRGEIAITTFKKRKEAALKNGADKVIKLPFKFSTQAAHAFASGAVSIVNKHKIDKLLFGSESNDVDNLIWIANFMKDNKEKYYSHLKKKLKLGFSFPKANAETLQDLIGKNITYPNDILGLEYVKAIINNEYKIKPYTLKRTIGYHSSDTKNYFASATKIREMIISGDDFSKYTPMKKDDFKKIKRIEDYYPKFQKIIKKMKPKKIAKFKLVSEGMENLFKKHIHIDNYNDFVNASVSKRYTSSRIKRVMLHILLKVKK